MRDFIETFKSLWYFYPEERWLLIFIAAPVLVGYYLFLFQESLLPLLAIARPRRGPPTPNNPAVIFITSQ